MEYIFKRLSRNTLSDLIPLFRAAFGKDVTEDELLKKYDTDFLGCSYIGFVAYDQDQNKPCAYYGVFPIVVTIEKTNYLVAQSGDTMTHPQHQGKGLFTKLAVKTYDLCRELGIKAVFGFPSDSSYPGFVKKLNWQHHENIENYTIWVYTLPISLLVKFKITKILYGIWQKIVLSFYKHGNHFKSTVLNNSPLAINRNFDFWNYKFRNRDNRCLKICNTDVIIKMDFSLGIGDMNISEERDFQKVVKGIKRLAFWLGINRISFYVSPQTSLSHYLKDKYAFKKGLAIGYLNLSDDVDLSLLRYTYFDFDTF